MSQAADLFRLEAATVRAGGRTLVRSLSLAVPRRRMVGLIGRNGSGKSTLVKLLAGQLRPSAGAVLCDGRPLSEWAPRALARTVAYLPQQIPAAPGLTVRELVGLGRYPWRGLLGRFGAEDRRTVEEALRLTGVAPFAHRAVDELSGGERQRVWLAMLVAQDAEGLLLDEPTSALDVAHQIEVLALVRDLCRRKGLCVVVVLHDVNMAARFCDEIVALRDGAFLFRGPPAEVMTPARLEAVYGVGMDVLPHPRSGDPLCVAL